MIFLDTQCSLTPPAAAAAAEVPPPHCMFSVSDPNGFQCAAFPSCYCVLWLLPPVFKRSIEELRVYVRGWWWLWHWQCKKRHSGSTVQWSCTAAARRAAYRAAARPLFLFSWMSIIRDIYLHNRSVSPPFFLYCAYSRWAKPSIASSRHAVLLCFSTWSTWNKHNGWIENQFVGALSGRAGLAWAALQLGPVRAADGPMYGLYKDRLCYDDNKGGGGEMADYN